MHSEHIRLVGFGLVRLLALGGCQAKGNGDGGGPAAERSEENAGSEQQPGDKTGDERSDDAAEDEASSGYDQTQAIDREYPELEATFNGEPVEIRAAIAHIEPGRNTADTPEGAVRVHLFSLPTACERGKKRFPLRKYKGEVVYLYMFQLGEATVSRTGGGLPAEGLNTTGFGGKGWGKLDFLSIDTTPGAETTIEIEGAREPPPSMKDDAASWSVKGKVTVVGCGEWLSWQERQKRKKAEQE